MLPRRGARPELVGAVVDGQVESIDLAPVSRGSARAQRDHRIGCRAPRRAGRSGCRCSRATSSSRPTTHGLERAQRDRGNDPRHRRRRPRGGAGRDRRRWTGAAGARHASAASELALERGDASGCWSRPRRRGHVSTHALHLGRRHVGAAFPGASLRPIALRARHLPPRRRAAARSTIARRPGQIEGTVRRRPRAQASRRSDPRAPCRDKGTRCSRCASPGAGTGLRSGSRGRNCSARSITSASSR